MKVIALLALALMLRQDGCANGSPAPTQQPTFQSNWRRECSADHRFANMSDLPISVRGDVALDTCSGQLCKTWEWVSQDKHVQNSYQSLALCADLAKLSEP
jgi:hypothetical protein